MRQLVLSPYAITVVLAGLPACAGESLRTPWDEALITGAVKAQLVREYGPALTQVRVTAVIGLFQKDPATATTLVDLVAEALGPEPRALSR
jgi:hypothetical protein